MENKKKKLCIEQMDGGYVVLTLGCYGQDEQKKVLTNLTDAFIELLQRFREGDATIQFDNELTDLLADFPACAFRILAERGAKRREAAEKERASKAADEECPL